jgi:hypothetical protein
VLSVSLPAFAQAPDVGPFAKTDPANEFSGLKVYGSDNSPLRRAREDWEGARKRIAGDPRWSAWVAERRAEVDDWMEKRKDRVEWVAGWWHDFVSPKDGSFLTWTPDEPGEETLTSPSDPKVKLTPKIHGGWVFVFRSRHTEKIWEAARLYRLTGDRKYAVWVAEQLDFYAENYQQWPLQRSKSLARLMHQSLDDANVLIRLVNAARLIDDHADERRRSRWIDLLVRPEAELLDQTFQRIHNIACWQRSAMAQAAAYANDPNLWARAVDGPFGIRKQIEHGVTSEYLWFEQSLLYNNYVVSALLPLFTLASLEGRAEELKHEMLVIENMMLAPIMLRFPDGRLPNPADATGGVQRAPNTQVLAGAYRVFPTALGLASAADLRNWDTLLDPPEPPPAHRPLPEVTARHLPASRMAILRKGDWQVFVHYGQLHASHAQSEALNFEAYYGNTDVTHDPGTVGYGSPLHVGFYRTGAAHNVPLVERQGQERWRPGEIVSFGPDRLVATQPDYRADASASRDLRIEGKKLIDTVKVTTGAGEPRRIGLVLHLQGEVVLPPESEAVEAPLPYWSDTKQIDSIDTVTVPVRFGPMTLNVIIETRGPFTVTFGRSPDMPPGKRHSIYVETTGTSAEFRTTIRPE